MNPKSIWSCWWQWNKSYSWIVGDEIHFRFLIASDHENIFHYSQTWDFPPSWQLKAVTMKMYGVNVVTRVAHVDTVTLALLQRNEAGAISSLIG